MIKEVKREESQAVIEDALEYFRGILGGHPSVPIGRFTLNTLGRDPRFKKDTFCITFTNHDDPAQNITWIINSCGKVLVRLNDIVDVSVSSLGIDTPIVITKNETHEVLPSHVAGLLRTLKRCVLSEMEKEREKLLAEGLYQ